MADYFIREQESRHRAGRMYAERAGFYAELDGRRITSVVTTREQAIAEAEAYVAATATPALVWPASPTPARADRSAMRVHRLMGDLGIDAPAPRATGRCHYCNLPLDRSGRCEECQ